MDTLSPVSGTETSLPLTETWTAGRCCCRAGTDLHTDICLLVSGWAASLTTWKVLSKTLKPPNRKNWALGYCFCHGCSSDHDFDTVVRCCLQDLIHLTKKMHRIGLNVTCLICSRLATCARFLTTCSLLQLRLVHIDLIGRHT